MGDRLKQNDLESLRIDAMSLDELNKLKTKLQCKIKTIEDAEKDLTDNTIKCIACQDNKKNIVFIDGCEHMVLCDECEEQITTKQCPLCAVKYTKIKKLNV